MLVDIAQALLALGTTLEDDMAKSEQSAKKTGSAASKTTKEAKPAKASKGSSSTKKKK
jgi:hypothetical protein